MGLCIDCKNFVFGKINIDGPDTPRHCGIGRDKDFNLWWNDNGTSPRDKASHAVCYEPTEGSKILDDVLGMSKEILEILKQLNG